MRHEEEQMPDEFLPIPVRIPCFDAWNLSVFVQRLKAPVQVDKEEAGETVTEEQKPITFKKLKISSFEKVVALPYEDEVRAEDEVDTIATQMHNCLSRLNSLNFVGQIGERVFWVLDWLPLLESVPERLSAALNFEVPAIDAAVKDYTTIKEEIDALVNELMTKKKRCGICDHVCHVEKLMTLLVYSLNMAACEMMSQDSSLYTITKRWLSYMEDAHDVFRTLVAAADTPPVIAARGVIDSIFTVIVDFMGDAGMIDQATNRHILAMTQYQICLSVRTLAQMIKKCEPKETSTIAHVIMMLDSIRASKTLTAIEPRLVHLCEHGVSKMGQMVFSIADADCISDEFRQLAEDLSQTPKGSEKLRYKLEGLRYNMMSLKFAETDAEIALCNNLDEVCKSLYEFNTVLHEVTDRDDSIYARNLAIPWNDFFIQVIDNLEALKQVSQVLSRGSHRYEQIYGYLAEIAAVLARLDGRDFPFSVFSVFAQLSKAFQKLKDYVSDQMPVKERSPECSSALATELIIKPLGDVTQPEAPVCAVDVVVPERLEAPVPMYRVFRKFMKRIHDCGFKSLSLVFWLNYSICDAMLQLANETKTAEEILAALKLPPGQCNDDLVWLQEFEVMDQLFRVSDFLAKISVENAKLCAEEACDFASLKPVFEGISDSLVWALEEDNSLQSQKNVFVRLLNFLNAFEHISQEVMEKPIDLINFVRQDLEFVSPHPCAGMLACCADKLRQYVRFMFHDNDRGVVKARLRKFCGSINALCDMFVSIPNSGHIHLRLAKRLKASVATMLENITFPEFHKYFTEVTLELEQIQAILGIIAAEEKETTEHGKFEKLMREMEVVIQTLFKTKDERGSSYTSMFESVAQILLGLKHTPVLRLRLKLKVEDLRNFIIAAQNIMFVDGQDTEEALDLLLNVVVPSFPDASDTRQALGAIIRSYQTREAIVCK